MGWEVAIRGMRNPMNSWEKSDSKWYSIGIPEYASREMTLDEIEKELGYKVKIINKEKNNGDGKKCDRCGKLYEHYPKGNKSQSNAIRKIQRDVLGGTVNAYSEWVMDLCPECMSEFDKFMTKGRSSDEK